MQRICISLSRYRQKDNNVNSLMSKCDCKQSSRYPKGSEEPRKKRKAFWILEILDCRDFCFPLEHASRDSWSDASTDELIILSFLSIKNFIANRFLDLALHRSANRIHVHFTEVELIKRCLSCLVNRIATHLYPPPGKGQFREKRGSLSRFHSSQLTGIYQTVACDCYSALLS